MELLAVVWATEYFRNYIYGRYFTVISDHKALLTLLNSSPKGNITFFSRLTRWYDRLVPYDFKVEHRQGSKMGMADYLSRFPSAKAPETSHYDENFTVAKIRMINAALKPKDKIKPRGQEVNNIQRKPTVGGVKSCFDTTKAVSSNENVRKDDYANIHREHKRSIEGVFTCNRRLTNQRRDICIPEEICKYRRTRFRLCSHCLNYSCKHKKLIQYPRNPSISTNYKYKPSVSKNYKCEASILQDCSEKPPTLKIYSSKDYSEKPVTLKKYSSKSERNNMSHSPEKNDPPTSAIVNTSTNLGNVNLSVVLNRLSQPPSVSSDSDIEMIPPEKLDTKQINSKKLNTIISFPHQFPGLSYPLVQNEKWIYSIVPSDSKIVKKIEHPEVLNIKLIEANIEKDPIMKTIRDNIRDRNPRAKEIITRLGQYYAQHYNDFAVRENCLWMDGRLAIPKDLSAAVLNRLHYNHHGRNKMFAAIKKDVWIPLMHRNIAATAKYCKSCLETGKNLKPDIPKNDMGETYNPKEPNDLVQLDFWGPVNYVRGRKTYVLVAVDTFSHWPSAYVCSSNKSKSVLKFLRKYINTHGHPRKLHMDQATGFFSNEIQNFCNYEGIELIKSPVRDHRATGLVERTIGSIKK